MRRRIKLRSESRSEKGVERDTSEKGNNWESKKSTEEQIIMATNHLILVESREILVRKEDGWEIVN